MYRAPVRPQRSPAAPRPPGRFPSPASGWGFHGTRSPFTGDGHHRSSPRGSSYSPSFSTCSPGSDRGYRDRSPAGFGSGFRGFGGQMRRRGDGFRRPQPFSPNSKSSESSVEKYFNPSMLQDPWAALRPLTAADTAAARRTM